MASRYKKVPEPVEGSKNWVRCTKCGTRQEFAMVDMNNHDLWCSLAKAKAKAAEVQKAKRAHSRHARR